MEELLDLDLSENEIEEIEFKTFRKLINLERLRLNDNQLRFIERDAFSSLTRLHGLFLNNNYLSSLPSLANLNELVTLNIENQNGRLTSLGDFAFDTHAKERYANTIVYMRSNPIVTFGERAFCNRLSNHSTATGIDVVYIDYDAFRHVDKCMLKQLKQQPWRRDGYPVYVVIDDPSIDHRTDVNKYKDVCNCETIAFARRNGVNFIGICQFLNMSCELSDDDDGEGLKVDDDCDSKPEFKCI